MRLLTVYVKVTEVCDRNVVQRFAEVTENECLKERHPFDKDASLTATVL